MFRVVVWAFICFYISGILFLSLAHLIHYGFSKENIYHIGGFILKLSTQPLFLFTAYKEWLDTFWLGYRFSQLTGAILLPLFPILLFFLIVFGTYVKSPYSFNLWFRLNNHYARFDDVRLMGLLDGFMAVLGKFQGNVLRLGKCLSIFVWGAPGLGKTTTVAIPSILESDGAGLLAIDCSGALAKYTSGYRSRLGNVFYFNWNLTDNPAKGEFWPRWNPLSDKDMPPKGHERDRYIAGIARYLLPQDKDNYWEKMACIAMEGLLQFFSCKISQACTNDYFLSELLDRKKLNQEDKDVLLSYYGLMPGEYADKAIENLLNDTLTIDNYLPVGSWENVPAVWQGKEFSLAMFADYLIQRYFTIMQEDANQDVGGWKIMLGELLKEASFFGYSPRALQVMQHLYYLSRKQRKIIFTIMLGPLAVFRKNSIRERTSASDISLKQVRGMKTPDGQWAPSSVYTVSDNRASAFMVKFFADMIIETGLKKREEQAPLPLLAVMDDFERLPNFKMLHEGLTHGAAEEMSFLLLTDGVKNIQANYGVEGLEEIISNTSYKLMFAENNLRLSEHFNRLAIYGTKSVQIPSIDTGAFYKVKKGLADANYYHRIAQGLMTKSKAFEVKKGQHLLLAEGFYHLPVRVNSMFFLKDDNLKAKAALGASYLLGETFVAKREPQDMETPHLLDVLHESGIAVENENDIDKYLEGKYDEMVEDIQDAKDQSSALAEDLSMRWKSHGSSESPKKKVKISEDDKDWWLEEDSFSVGENSSANPFEKGGS